MREFLIPAKAIKLYAFSELSESAQDKALETHCISSDYSWHDENQKSLKSFCAEIGINAPDFSYGEAPPFIKKITDEDLEEISLANPENKGELDYLIRKFHEDPYCLTGYCADSSLTMTFADVMVQTQSLKDAINTSLQTWLETSQGDWDFYFSKAYLEELSSYENDWEYLETGEYFDEYKYRAVS